MIIIQDSREKLTQNGKPTRAAEIANEWTASGIRVVRRRMAAGDYMLPQGRVAVERKGSVSELALNVADIHAVYETGTDKRTNWQKMIEECDVAWMYGQKLVFVIASGQHNYQSLNDVRKWRAWTTDPRECWWCAEAARAGVDGSLIADRLEYLVAQYGIDIVFTHNTAKTILETLNGRN